MLQMNFFIENKFYQKYLYFCKVTRFKRKVLLERQLIAGKNRINSNYNKI